MVNCPPSVGDGGGGVKPFHPVPLPRDVLDFAPPFCSLRMVWSPALCWGSNGAYGPLLIADGSGPLLFAGGPLDLMYARRYMGPRRSNCNKTPLIRVWRDRSRCRKVSVLHRENSLGYGETLPYRAHDAAEDPPRGLLVLFAARYASQCLRTSLPKDGGPWRGRKRRKSGFRFND